ncbi:MAG: bifunctional nuclease family protein [Bacillota bacterium]
MVVDKVGLDIESEQAIVLLRDVQGTTMLPIWVGPAEATAIALSIQGVKASRPLTCDLLKDVIDHLEARVVMVLVSDLKEHTFYARLVLRRSEGNVEVDCRPSDAIALALRAEAPIYVSEAVVAEAGVPAEQEGAGPVH